MRPQGACDPSSLSLSLWSAGTVTHFRSSSLLIAAIRPRRPLTAACQLSFAAAEKFVPYITPACKLRLYCYLWYISPSFVYPARAAPDIHRQFPWLTANCYFSLLLVTDPELFDTVFHLEVLAVSLVTLIVYTHLARRIDFLVSNFFGRPTIDSDGTFTKSKYISIYVDFTTE